jgi:FkbM family methyltransferase
VIVDLGANVGYTVAHFAYLYPRARIVGLELDRDNFVVALQNTDWCKERVTLINAAVWSSDGYVKFSGVGEDAYHVIAAVSDQAGECMSSSSPMARSVTMQSLLAEQNIAHIDYLKMDIEGGEREIMLKGDRSWMEKVDVMKIELHHVAYQGVADVLTSHGFRCWKGYMGVPCIIATRA